MKAPIVVIAAFLFVVACMVMCDSPVLNPVLTPVARVLGSLTDMNTRGLRGPYLTAKWIAPENIIYYRCFVAGDSNSIATNPFKCKEIFSPPPLRAGREQELIVLYRPEKFDYEIYIEIFAFDIDGNYFNVEITSFE